MGLSRERQTLPTVVLPN